MPWSIAKQKKPTSPLDQQKNRMQFLLMVRRQIAQRKKAGEKKGSFEHIYVTGRPGAGKTTLAQQLSKQHSLPLISLDGVPGMTHTDDTSELTRKLISGLDERSVIEGVQLMGLQKDLKGKDVRYLQGDTDTLADRLIHRGFEVEPGKVLKGKKHLGAARDMLGKIHDWGPATKRAAMTVIERSMSPESWAAIGGKKGDKLMQADMSPEQVQAISQQLFPGFYMDDGKDIVFRGGQRFGAGDPAARAYGEQVGLPEGDMPGHLFPEKRAAITGPLYHLLCDQEKNSVDITPSPGPGSNAIKLSVDCTQSMSPAVSGAANQLGAFNPTPVPATSCSWQGPYAQANDPVAGASSVFGHSLFKGLLGRPLGSTTTGPGAGPTATPGGVKLATGMDIKRIIRPVEFQAQLNPQGEKEIEQQFNKLVDQPAGQIDCRSQNLPSDSHTPSGVPTASQAVDEKAAAAIMARVATKLSRKADDGEQYGSLRDKKQ